MMRIGFALLAVTTLLFGLVTYSGPDLWKDFKLRNQPMLPATDAKVGSAKCDTYYYLVSLCRIDVERTDRTTARLHYTFLGSMADQRFRLVRPATDPRVVRADIGFAKIWNRISGFLLVAAVLLGMIMVGVRKMADA